MVLMVLVAALAAWRSEYHQIRRRISESEAAVAEGQRLIRERQYSRAVATLKRGLDGVRELPLQGELVAHLRILLRQAEAAQTVAGLHVIADKIRAVYGMDMLPAAALHTLAERCRSIWDKRDQIQERLGQEGLSEADRRQVRDDLLDLAILWTDLRVSLAAGPDPERTRREAVAVLDEAEDTIGPSPVLRHERRRLTKAPAVTDRDPEPPARTGWEHYALGASYMRSGDLKAAATELRKACALEPAGFWPQFYAGTCAYRGANYQDAVTAFSVCIGSPEANAVCFYNRGLAYAAMARHEQAVNDYGHALAMDPTMAPAALNRGIEHFRQRDYVVATADLRLALTLGSDPASVHYNLALVHEAQGARQDALEDLSRALASRPSHTESLQLRDRLRRAADGASWIPKPAQSSRTRPVH
jgi:tetratricopeptide (TPR) repeat protein